MAIDVKKYYSILGDSVINIVAFTILVGAQQLLAFPVIAKNISPLKSVSNSLLA